MSSLLLTPKEAAEELAISIKRVHALCRAGKLAFVEVDDRGARRFTRAQLAEFVQRQTVRPPKLIDRDTVNQLPSHPKPVEKGGDRTIDAFGVDLRKEMRKWR